jgi:hypothetical protein
MILEQVGHVIQLHVVVEQESFVVNHLVEVMEEVVEAVS